MSGTSSPASLTVPEANRLIETPPIDDDVVGERPASAVGGDGTAEEVERIGRWGLEHGG